MARKQGLIVGSVALVRRPARCDIGRQRHVAPLLDRLVEHWTMEREGQRDLAPLPFVLDGGIELAEKAHAALVAETDHVARGELLGAARKRPPARPVNALMQRHLDPSALAAAKAPPS